jgi:putative isomerase
MRVWLLLVAHVCAAAFQRDDFINILNASIASPDYVVLSDMGSWHGFLLAVPTTQWTGLAGPYIHGGSGLLADSALQLSVTSGSLMPIKQVFAPGQLTVIATAASQNLTIEMRTIFISSRSSATAITFLLNGDAPQSVSFSVAGDVNHAAHPDVSATDREVVVVTDKTSASTSPQLILNFSPNSAITISTNKSGYVARGNLSVAPHQAVTIHVIITYCLNPTEVGNESSTIAAFFRDPDNAYEENGKRWNGYIEKVTSTMYTPQENWLAVKAVTTLLTNWRSVGELFKHDGLYPSFEKYPGFWGWDSWKHARALARFAPEIAMNQVQ